MLKEIYISTILCIYICVLNLRVFMPICILVLNFCVILCIGYAFILPWKYKTISADTPLLLSVKPKPAPEIQTGAECHTSRRKKSAGVEDVLRKKATLPPSPPPLARTPPSAAAQKLT